MVSWARGEDLFRGLETNKFKPNTPVKREEIALIAHNYFQGYGKILISSSEEKLTYKDVNEISQAMKPSVKAIYDMELMKGTEENLFHSQKSLTRAEAATLIKRMDLKFKGIPIEKGNTETNINDGFDVEKKMIFLGFVNELRRQNGMGPLKYSSKVDQAAMIRAKETAAFFSHTRPDGRDFDTVYYGLGFGSVYEYSFLGENITYSMGSTYRAEKAFEIFKNSPAHFQNMVNLILNT